MASGTEYLNYVLEQLDGLEDIEYRAMMGEYILYYRGKVVGGIYDDRFLVKPTETAKRLMPDAPFEVPYEGGKEMLLVGEGENKEFFKQLFDGMYGELTFPKRKRT